MSDLMLLGVLRMPMEEYACDLKLLQFIERAREAADRIEDDASEIAALRRRVAQMETALKPFAGLYDSSWQQFEGDREYIEVGNFASVTLDDLLHARAALSPSPPAEEIGAPDVHPVSRDRK